TEKSNKQDSLEYIALGLEGITFSLPKEESQIGLFTYQGDREDILFSLNNLLQEVREGNSDFEIICKNIINIFVVKLCRAKYINFYMNKLIQEVREGNSDFEIIYQNIIEILVVKLRRAKNIRIQNNKPKQINQAVSLVKHYINQNYREPITLDMLARIGNINKYYLAHTFKQDLGVSPIEYLNQVRIKEAKILLETTNYTIAEIARFNGFSSQSFFSQAFRREVDQTPSEYRKQSRHQAETSEVITN